MPHSMKECSCLFNTASLQTELYDVIKNMEIDEDRIKNKFSQYEQDKLKEKIKFGQNMVTEIVGSNKKRATILSQCEDSHRRL